MSATADHDQIESLDGQVRVIGTLNWAELAISRPEFLVDSLTALGLPSTSIAEAASLTRHQLRPVPGGRRSPLDVDYFGKHGGGQVGRPPYGGTPDPFTARPLTRLRDWLAGHHTQVDDSQLTEVKVPLFLLTAPAIPGCSVELETSHTDANSVGWSLKLFGTGLEGGFKTATTMTSTFTAQPGETRQAFVPVTVEACRVTVTDDDGRILGHGYATHVHKPTGMNPAARPVPASTGQPDGSTPQVFPLEDTEPGRASTYVMDQVSTAEHTISLGFTAFGQDQKITATVGLQHEVKLTCILVGGYRYFARNVDAQPGVVWEARPR